MPLFVGCSPSLGRFLGWTATHRVSFHRPTLRTRWLNRTPTRILHMQRGVLPSRQRSAETMYISMGFQTSLKNTRNSAGPRPLPVEVLPIRIIPFINIPSGHGAHYWRCLRFSLIYLAWAIVSSIMYKAADLADES